VVALLGRAQSEKPPVVLRADRVARGFVAAVLVLAAGTAAAWSQIAPERAFEVTLSVLVATCPCALSLATPVALAAAQSALARAGLLVTRGHVVERLADADRFVFDKTGTLTRGEPTLIDGRAEPGHDRRRMLALAAELEARSEHPLARALRRAWRELGVEDGAERPFDVQQVEPVVGSGLEAQVDGETLRIGRPDWVAELARADHAEPEEVLGLGANEAGDAHVWIALGDAKGRRALFAFDDPMREEAPEALERLRNRGLALELATGDPSPAAARLAHALALEAPCIGASPEVKRARVAELQRAGERVVFVGDGVNDAPVLGQADVSIAMGGGTDLAKIGADAVLLGDRLALLPAAVDHARRTRAIIRQNLAWAIVYNAAVLPLAMSGSLPPWIAALGMSLSSVWVVANGARVARLRGNA
jgi:Cu2+-exporting ATPase